VPVFSKGIGMAKKDKKSAKLPRKVAGIKVPKGLRDTEALAKLAKHPLVTDLLAAGLVALAAKVRDKPANNTAPDKPGTNGSDAMTELSKGAAVLAGMFATKASEQFAKFREAASAPAEPKPAPAEPKPAPTAAKPAAAEPKAKAPRKPAAKTATAKPVRKPANKTAH
jgi:hypothetical protein